MNVKIPSSSLHLNMVLKVAINGFGRVGRLIFRALRRYYPREIEVVAVHDLCDIHTNIHLLFYDSAHKKFPEQVTITHEDTFEVGTGSHKWVVKNLTGKLGPSELPWAELGVDVVVESTGLFRSHSVKKEDGSLEKDGYDGHIQAGAKKVILSVNPTDRIETTIVLGANDEDLTPETQFISISTCTTNCLAPVLKILNDHFSIKDGFVTAVHAYTPDQVVSDVMHKDIRRARAAGQNIIPSVTGAILGVKRVVKNLTRGCLNGISLRVPTVTGSLVDITVNTRDEVTVEQVNEVFREASQTKELHPFVDYTDEPIVSSDIIDNPHSAVIDTLSTMVIKNEDLGGSLVKVLAWYDNEWMYSCRCADVVHRIAHFLQ